MNKEKATIYDYARFCNSHNRNCCNCELYSMCRVGYNCNWVLRNHTDESNKIILNWCKGHPEKTRQDKFLEMFPNAEMHNGCVEVCPLIVENGHKCLRDTKAFTDCYDCKKSYWLAEAEEQ